MNKVKHKIVMIIAIMYLAIMIAWFIPVILVGVFIFMARGRSIAKGQGVKIIRHGYSESNYLDNNLVTCLPVRNWENIVRFLMKILDLR